MRACVLKIRVSFYVIMRYADIDYADKYLRLYALRRATPAAAQKMRAAI